MDVRDFNRRAWDALVDKGNRWTVPVGPEVIAEARAGRWDVVLTPTRPVPHEWFGPLAGRDSAGSGFFFFGIFRTVSGVWATT